MNKQQLVALEFCNASNPTMAKLKEVINTVDLNPLVSQGFIASFQGSCFTTTQGKDFFKRYCTVSPEGEYHLQSDNMIPPCCNHLTMIPGMEIEVVDGPAQGLCASVLYTTETGAVIDFRGKLRHIPRRWISVRRTQLARRK